jgi:4-amino-4-deoxychorismate lyase
MRILVNGREASQVDPRDRGLHYGDGLFETMAVLAGRPRFLDWHFERLALGAERLGLPLPDLQQLQDEIAAACPEPRGVVKIIVTRGVGPRGYRPPTRQEPTRIVVAAPWPDLPAAAWTEGVRLGWCRTRYGRNPALAGLKHLNRLEQVLARAEWDDGRMDEGLMQDDLGQVISATQANLFARIDGQWTTPSVEQCGVAGVMRRAFRHWSSEMGDAVVERAVLAQELVRASHLILTNALIGAWPVRELAGHALTLESGAAQFNVWLARQ